MLLLLLTAAAMAGNAGETRRSLPETVSVGLVTGQRSLTLRLPQGTRMIGPADAALQQFEVETTLVCGVGPNGTIVAGGMNYGRPPLRFDGGPSLLGWGARPYRGVFVVLVTARGLTLVNEVRLEDYLRGVVPEEVIPGWPIEALKAQAVAARTFAVGRLAYHQKDGFDLCASVDCQVYAGAGAEVQTTDEAVAATAGQVLTYNGRLASVYYHAASGGHTEDVEHVWRGATPFAYLRGVPDPAEASPYDRWQVEFDWAGVEEAVAAKYPAIGRVLAVNVTGRTAAGRVLSVELVGERGVAGINGEALRALFSLRSALCDLTIEYGPVPEPQAVDLAATPAMHALAPSAVPLWSGLERASWALTPVCLSIQGRGWGHGVGLSQWGAKGLAELGYMHTMILGYYYQGTQVEDWRPAPDVPPDPTNGAAASDAS